MIPYADEILQQTLTAAKEAFQEIVYPVAVGGDFPQIVLDGTMAAQTELHKIWGTGLTPEGLARALKQVILAAAFVEGHRPERSYQRGMEQVATQLSAEVTLRTDPSRPEDYADVSVFIADDAFKAAVAVAASHLVGSAARKFKTLDEKELAIFIAAELDEGNPFILADVGAITAAARE